MADGDFIHGWDMDWTHLEDHIAPAPDFIGKVHGDGTFGNMVTIVCSNKPRILVEHKYWCWVLPDES